MTASKMQHNLFVFIAHYGYAGIFGALMLGIIGAPVPDEFLMTFSGYLVSKGKMHFVPTVIVSVLGSFAGMSLSYAIGYKFGYPLVEKYGQKVHITKEKLERTQIWFGRFGKFALTVGYFVPGLRHLTAYSAGISKWPYRSFCLYAVPGAMLWAIAFIALGTYLGEHWHAVTTAIHRYLLLGFAVLAAAAAAIWYLKKARGKRMAAK
ncbi:DedA family protein [Paenibacillus hamazuiensis]|uniref:DedA family protein n=1 Tax=Paenibacillus hamazuiensis TaxID=2936508 RepID=UPI00200F4F6D|nr:DedA family protein [Paenibacillus hamazuiensis]